MQRGGGCDSRTGRNTLSLDVVGRHFIQTSLASKKTAVTGKSKSSSVCIIYACSVMAVLTLRTRGAIFDANSIDQTLRVKVKREI